MCDEVFSLENNDFKVAKLQQPNISSVFSHALYLYPVCVSHTHSRTQYATVFIHFLHFGHVVPITDFITHGVKPVRLIPFSKRSYTFVPCLVTFLVKSTTPFYFF